MNLILVITVPMASDDFIAGNTVQHHNTEKQVSSHRLDGKLIMGYISGGADLAYKKKIK